MLTYKCAHCASPITVEDSQRVGQCPVCGSIFVFPNQYAAKSNLYRLASEALQTRNFDVAMTYYSRILKVDAIETAAHWGYLLSKYGIELSTDPKTMHQILFHRVERTPFMEDPSYEKMIAYCPADARYYYEGLSRQIAEKQRKLWAIADQVGEYDIYINCVEGPGTADYLLANQVGKALDEAGYRVFLPCTMLGNVPAAEKNLYEMAVAEKAASMMVVVTKQTKMTDSRYQAIWKRYLAYHRQDAGRKMLSVYQEIKPEDLPLELQPLQSMECSGADFQDVVLTEINKMFGRQNRSASMTREILEQLREGQEHLAAGRFEDAELCFRLVLELDVEEPQAQWGLVCATTENLKKPVLSDEFDAMYNRALQLAKGETKEKHRSVVSELMAEPAWNALMKQTRSLELLEISEAETVKAAIDRVYLYMPKGDSRLQQIVDYRKNAQMEREAKQILESYQKRDVTAQPLFAEQQKAENEYNAVNVGNLRTLFQGNIWLVGYALSYVFLVVSQFMQITITRNIAGPGMIEFDLSLCDGFLIVGMVIFSITLLSMCWKKERKLSFIFRFCIHATVAWVAYILSLIFYEAIHMLVLALPLIAILMLMLMAMQESRMLKSGVRRCKKAEEAIRNIDAKIVTAYQETMKAHYTKYGHPDHAIPPYHAYHSSGFSIEQRYGSESGGSALWIKSAVVLVAAILIPTVVSNMTYASKWHDVVEITGGNYHVVGLRSDGTVVASGANYRGQCEVDEWEDIVQLAAGGYFTVGLKSDGTVVVTGSDYNFIEIREWKDVVAISVARDHVIALTEDGTCLAAELGKDGAAEVEGFENVVAVYAARINNVNGSLALTSDGHLYLTEGWGEISDEIENMTGSAEGQLQITKVYYRGDTFVVVDATGTCHLLKMESGGSFTELSGWNGDEIVEALGGTNSLALIQDGTVKFVGKNNVMEETVAEWTDIVDIDGGWTHVLGLRQDGTVVTAGLNDYGQGDVDDWKKIAKILSLGSTSFGVKENGSVVACGKSVCGMTYVNSKNPIELLQFWWSAIEWDATMS